MIQGSWKNKITASEITEERAKSANDKEELAILFFGSREVYDDFTLSQKVLASHPTTVNSHHFYEMTREEQHRDWMKKMNHICCKWTNSHHRNRFLNTD